MPARKYFYGSAKDGKIGDDGKKSDGHISLKDYLTCETIWDKFDIKDFTHTKSTKSIKSIKTTKRK